MITGALTMRELTEVVATVCSDPTYPRRAGDRSEEANCSGPPSGRFAEVIAVLEQCFFDPLLPEACRARRPGNASN
jgi:hypothetical protein